MSQAEQQPQLTDQKPKNRILRSIMWVLGLFMLSLVLVLGYMFSTDRGSKFLLDRVLERQSMIQYHYEQGNLLNGIVLKDVLVSLAAVDVEIAHVEVVLGWRAILNKEIHLNRANTENLIIRLKGEPPVEDTPFTYPAIKLPFVLRVDEANVDHLSIITKGKTEIDFYHIYLNETVWSDTKIDFNNISMDMGYLNVRQATGYINFIDKYPLKLKALLNLPSLRSSIDIHDIHVMANGSLDTITAGVSSQTPDLLRGWVVVHPMRDMVPMFGKLKFDQYHLPFLTDYQLFVEQGQVGFKGTYEGFDLDLNAAIEGENIPQGQYLGNMYVDFVEGLKIHRLDASMMQGQLGLTGDLNWSEDFYWNMAGQLTGLDPQHERIPEVIREFLPPTLDGRIASEGSLKDGLHLTAAVDFNGFETWQATLDQAAVIDKPEPMQLNVAWKNMDRAMPYVGWLKSDQGHIELQLLEQQQQIQFKTAVAAHDNALLPEGRYQARLNFQEQNLNIPVFEYIAQKGSLKGQAFVELPTEKRALKWRAVLNADHFNPQSISAASPVDVITGRLNASGQAKVNQQQIILKDIDLLGRLAGQQETIRLTGQSTADLNFASPQQGGGFKNFAVAYDGTLQSSQFKVGDGHLNIRVNGTPQQIDIRQFKHYGAAGRIDAKAQLDLTRGIGWQANAALVRFKPHYFVSMLQGEVSGNIATRGIWSDQLKNIHIQRLNIAGMLNKKPLRGTGDLSVVLEQKQNTLRPTKFSAQSFLLSYANNKIQVSGDERHLAINLDAQRLYELYPGLIGKAKGFIHLKTEPRWMATTQLALDRFAFRDLVQIEKARIQGELPTSDTTPTQLIASIQGLRTGNRHMEKGEIRLAGTYGAHVLRVSASNKISQLGVQLAGGFKDGTWLGQIQKGDFDSYRTRLVQRQNAALIYNTKQSTLYVGAHCWMSQQSEICADKPVRIGPQGGAFSLISRNLDLNDFSAFMPEGLNITGKVNGHAKAEWKQGARPVIDMSLVTRDGTVGLSDQQESQSATNLSYKRVELIAKSIATGLKLRLDLETQELGRGYANVDINPYADRMPMSGVVAFDGINLKVFKPFIADVRQLVGNLSYTGQIGGYLTAPEVAGQLRLKDGAISMISVPVNLNNIQLYARTAGTRADIAATFNAGTGKGRLTGMADWKNDPSIALVLKGQQLQVRQVPLVSAWVTPDLNVEIKPISKYVKVEGSVDVPRANIFMPETSAPVVNTSADVRVVDEHRHPLEILKVARPWDVRAKIKVTLGPKDVYFQGFNSRIPLAGQLNLEQRGLESAMRASGIIGVTERATVEAYGQSLTIQRALARFNGALSNPILDIDANKTVQGTQIGLRVTGGASNPAIDIYSDSGLSEQEALNALLTGRIDEGSSNLSQTEGFKSDVNNTIAAAGISMGLGGTRALTNQIGRSLGLKGLALDAQGTGDDTQVSVTGYITPELFIRYGIGVFTPVNKLTLRYQMNKRLYLEASQSLERAIDVFYNWRF